jgi:hypothetical protein
MAEQTIDQVRAETWRAAAEVVRVHRAGVSTFGGEAVREVEGALFALAKELDERAEQAARGDR